MMSRRDSELAARVLDALARHSHRHGGWMYGLDIAKATGLPRDSFYPALLRLEQAGWIESKWEDDDGPSGHRRRLYRLTTPRPEGRGFQQSPTGVPASPGSAPDCSEVLRPLHRHSEPRLPDPDRPPVPSVLPAPRTLIASVGVVVTDKFDATTQVGQCRLHRVKPR